MKKRLKNSKDAAVYRKELLKEQNGIDPITGCPITLPVLDHYHQGEQHCRAVLQNEVNAFEGKVANSYRRYLSHITDKPLHEILRNLADYLEKHDSTAENEMVIHHTALTVDTNKFKRLNSAEQCRILTVLGTEPETNSVKRSKQARKLIRDGILNMNRLP